MFHSLQKIAQLSHVKRSGLQALAFVAVLALWSCGYSPVKIYQPEVVQGNFVSKDQVQALRAGMPRQAVRDILGTPLVTSVFHAERWDYAFTIRRQGSEPQLRRFTVYFKGDVLDRVDGDPLPTEAEFAAKLDTRRLQAILRLRAIRVNFLYISNNHGTPHTPHPSRCCRRQWSHGPHVDRSIAIRFTLPSCWRARYSFKPRHWQ